MRIVVLESFTSFPFNATVLRLFYGVENVLCRCKSGVKYWKQAVPCIDLNFFIVVDIALDWVHLLSMNLCILIFDKIR